MTRRKHDAPATLTPAMPPPPPAFVACPSYALAWRDAVGDTALAVWALLAHTDGQRCAMRAVAAYLRLSAGEMFDALQALDDVGLLSLRAEGQAPEDV
jgi:hypothetical protein